MNKKTYPKENEVPGQPQIPQFSGHVPAIGQQQKQMQAQLKMAIQQLSQAIYVPSAISHIATRDEHQEADPDRMRQLARDSVAAAKCYFEGTGVIKTEQEKEDSL